MSGQIESFPLPGSPWRDLGNPDVWSRSLARSVQRRELSALSRKHAKRRKGATFAVSATMAFTRSAASAASFLINHRSLSLDAYKTTRQVRVWKRSRIPPGILVVKKPAWAGGRPGSGSQV